MILVFDGTVGTDDTLCLTRDDAETLGADVVWVTDLPATPEALSQSLDSLRQEIEQKLKVRELDSTEVTCLGLSPQSSAIALDCALRIGAAHVLCLGLSSSAWASVMATTTGTHTQIIIISAANDTHRDANVTWLLPELHRLPDCSIVQWRMPCDSDFTHVLRSSKSYWMALLTLLAHGTDVQLRGASSVGDIPSRTRQVSLTQWKSRDGVFQISQTRLSEGKLFIEGVAFFRGHALPDYASIYHSLILESESQRVVLPLGGVQDSTFSDRYVRRVRINYLTAGFADPRHKGLLLSGLPLGRYLMSVRTTEYGRDEERLLEFCQHGHIVHCWADRAYGIFADSAGYAVLDISEIPLTNPSEPYVFHLNEACVEGMMLHVRGRFAIQGFPMRQYDDGDYYLWLNDPVRHTFFTPRLGIVRDKMSDTSFDHPEDYLACNFADINHAGVDLSHTSSGTYDWRIVLVGNGRAASARCGSIIIGGDNSITLQIKE